MVEFGTSSAFRGWVRVRVLGYGFGVRDRKVKSRDRALASDLVKARVVYGLLPQRSAAAAPQRLFNLLSARSLPGYLRLCSFGGKRREEPRSPATHSPLSHRRCCARRAMRAW